MYGPSLTGYRDRHNRFGYLPDPQRFGMAAHEAAHAGSLGYRVDSVRIEHRPNGHLSWDGLCEYRDAPDWNDGERLLHEAIGAAAAYAGQQYLEGIVRYQLPDHLLGGDAAQLTRVADQLDAMSYQSHRTHALSLADRALCAHVATWWAVTYALMRAESLDADTLHRIDSDLFPTEPAREPVRAERTSTPGHRAGRKRIESKDLIPGLRYSGALPIETLEGRCE